MNVYKLKNKTVIITGASSGVGEALAMECAEEGACLILACRDPQRSLKVVNRIRELTSNNDVHHMTLNLASMESVANFAKRFREKFSSLYALVNNAAYMGPQTLSEDGIELTYQTNYLSAFLLTRLLIDSYERQQGDMLRVVNVASDAALRAEASAVMPLDKRRLAGEEEHYSFYRSYARSKLAQCLMMREVNRRYGDTAHVCCVSVHPGAVNTRILRNWSGLFGSALRLVSRACFRPPESAAASLMWTLTDANIDALRNELVFDGAKMKLTEVMRDDDLAENLWQQSEELCQSYLQQPLCI